MKQGLKYIFLLYLAVVLASPLFAHFNQTNPSTSSARFIENKGQWPTQVLFGAKLSSGMIFIENDGITFNICDPEAMSNAYGNSHNHNTKGSDELSAHSFKLEFINSSHPIAEGKNIYADYMNYIIGNDQSKWAHNAAIFSEVYLHNIYPGIDVRYYERAGHLKYDFIVQPGANASLIQFYHKGINTELKNNSIILNSPLGKITEQAPFTYQNKNTIVPSKYIKNENGYFSIKTSDYNSKLPLIIDPVVVFASFTGSTSDNWGYTATYDESGNLYAAGVVFGTGYPVTTGVYKTTFSGFMDLSVTKFSSNGTSLMYSTNIGGSEIESPHSLVVSNKNELLIFGSTSSADFPTSATAYDKTFNGGTFASLDNDYLKYSSGSDIFITKLSADGSSLIGSTLIGGSKNDGLNDEYVSSNLFHNYADVFRGEIIVDNAGNAYVATTTGSNDFPIVAGFQNTFAGGNHDGIIMKLNNDLSALLWSSYIGGSGDDATYSVQFDSNFDLYVTGGTNSADFPTTGGVLNPNALGDIDGYISHISANGQTLLESTYIGTALYDQSYFVQVDKSDNVYVFGQSAGAYPVFPPAVYSVANSNQFIHKLNSALTTTVFSTVFGSGSGNIDLIPSAFLVSNCDDIYISAWGGEVNQYHTSTPSSTTGMPITPDAYQSATDGSDFYLAVFSPDAMSLKYGTFFGGATTAEHVDGGTSRFDKNGNVYQAVCGGCGGSSDFPTTPGVWSNTNNSINCNLAAIKFDVSKLTAIISGTVDTVACKNEPIFFNNQSNGGLTYEWDFGDGSKSTEYSPTYTYADTGYYKVTLLAIDAGGCPPVDTTYLNIHVLPQVELTVFPNDSVCPGESVTLTASGATIYQWSPAATLNQSTGTSVIATPFGITTYKVNGNSFCNKDSAEITISLFSTDHSMSLSDSICEGTSYTVFATPGNSFQWSPAKYFNDPTTGFPDVTLDSSRTLYVSFKSPDGCDINDSVFLNVVYSPDFNIQKDTVICIGESLQLDPGVSGYQTHVWIPDTDLSDNQSNTPIANPSATTLYQYVFSNECGEDTTDYLVNVSKVQGSITPNTSICPNDSISLLATGGTKYQWLPAETLSNDTIPNPMAHPLTNTTYQVNITNADGCKDSLFTSISFFNLSHVISATDTICQNSPYSVFASPGNSYQWTPPPYFSNSTTSPTDVRLDSSQTIYVSFNSPEGCAINDSIQLFVINPPDFNIQKDTVICIDESLQLDPGVFGYQTHVWIPDTDLSDDQSNTPIANPSATTLYQYVFSNECGEDTTDYLINVSKVQGSITPNTSICPNDSIVLIASGGTKYKWLPAETISNDTISNPMAHPNINTIYQVNITNSDGCKDSLFTSISLFDLNHVVSPTDSVCPGITHNVWAGPGSSFQWAPSQYFNDATTSSPNVTLNQSRTIFVSFKSLDGCTINDSVPLKVITPPDFSGQQDSLICYGDSLQLNPGADGNYTYNWIPDTYLSDAHIKMPIATTQATTLYQSIISNMCGNDTTSYLVQVSKIKGSISSDTTICINDSIQINATGGTKYLWTPTATLSNNSISNPIAFPQENTTYKVIIKNDDGCKDSLSTQISIASKPYTGIQGDYLLEYGESVQIKTDFKDYISWSPSTYLSCDDCANPEVKIPESDIKYTYKYYDKQGCFYKDSIQVYVIRKVYVPNAFTPNGDNVNDVFYFRSISVEEFEMMIFDRWGELLFTSNDINQGWNGIYKGNPVQMDVYVWKVRYRRFHKNIWHEEIGRVSLIR